MKVSWIKFLLCADLLHCEVLLCKDKIKMSRTCTIFLNVIEILFGNTA